MTPVDIMDETMVCNICGEEKPASKGAWCDVPVGRVMGGETNTEWICDMCAEEEKCQKSGS